MLPDAQGRAVTARGRGRDHPLNLPQPALNVLAIFCSAASTRTGCGCQQSLAGCSIGVKNGDF